LNLKLKVIDYRFFSTGRLALLCKVYNEKFAAEKRFYHTITYIKRQTYKWGTQRELIEEEKKIC
jgi:hypothetical protein